MHIVNYSQMLHVWIGLSNQVHRIVCVIGLDDSFLFSSHYHFV